MYTTDLTPSDVETEVFADRWRPNRCRVQLTVSLDTDVDDMHAALQRLGYEPVDADQWGWSYRHPEKPDLTAELDELDNPYRTVRLILEREDLAPDEVNSAASDLDVTYGRLCAATSGSMAEPDYEACVGTDEG